MVTLAEAALKFSNSSSPTSPPLAAELLDVEVVGAHAYLLVGVEGDAYLAVLDVGVLLQVDHGLYDLGDAGLVVGAEQRVAVGDDEVFAHVLQEFGKFLGRHGDALGEQNVGAAVVVDNLWLDVGS